MRIRPFGWCLLAAVVGPTLAACGGEVQVADESGLIPYANLGLRAPGTWQELVRLEPPLDTSTIRVTPDLFGRLWREILVLGGGGPEPRLKFDRVDSIRVTPVMTGRRGRGTSFDPVVYLLDYTGDGFHWLNRWIVVPIGTEIFIEAGDWGAFETEEGRLVLRRDGVEFIPGSVETPEGLCETYRGRLRVSAFHDCGAEAVAEQFRSNVPADDGGG